MSDYDTTIGSLLEQIGPSTSLVAPDWDRVLNDAAEPGETDSVRARPPRWSRRKAAVVCACIAIVLAIPLIALAATNNWWFQHSPGPQMEPSSGEPSIVATGTWQGRDWTLIAYPGLLHIPPPKPGQVTLPAAPGGLCTFVILGKLTNTPEEGSCGPLRGVRNSQPSGPADGWLTVMASSDPPMVLGAVARGVAKVELTVQNYLSDKTTTMTVPLRSATGIGGGVRFYLYRSTANGVIRITALDPSNRVLSRLSP